MARKPASSRPTKAAPARSTPLLEWSVAGLGLVLTLAALTVILFEAVQPATPPDLALSLTDVHATAGGHVAEVEVKNRGRLTAADVQIEGVLTLPSAFPETASATLTYAPGQGTETISLAFRGDPRQGRLELTARGWSEP